MLDDLQDDPGRWVMARGMPYMTIVVGIAFLSFVLLVAIGLVTSLYADTMLCAERVDVISGEGRTTCPVGTTASFVEQADRVIVSCRCPTEKP